VFKIYFEFKETEKTAESFLKPAVPVVSAA
jgi:hypothetical protein